MLGKEVFIFLNKMKINNMDKKIKQKITWISYLSFAFIGTIFMLQGVMKIEMAADFGVETYIMQSIFTIFTIADTLAIYLNKYFIRKMKLKKIILLAILFVFIGTLGVALSKNIISFSIFIFIYGFATGIFVSLGNYLIISMYNSERSQKLNMLNFSYAFGSLLTPGFAAWLTKYNVSWTIIFLGSLIFLLFITYLTINSNFEFIEIFEESKKEEQNKIDLPVFMVGIAMFSYVNSEMVFNNWLVEYFVEKGITLSNAKYSLSIYWIFIAIGRFLSGTLLKKIKTSKYILSFSLMAILSFLLLFIAKDIRYIFLIVALMGFAYSGLYANILSYGTELGGSSASRMTFYISMGSVGGIVSSPLSSIIRKSFGIDYCLTLAMFFILGIIICILFTFIFVSKKNYINKKMY